MSEIKVIKTEWAERDNYVCLLYDGDVFKGIVEVSVHKEKKEAYIWNLNVEEEHRGNGLGRELLGKALSIAGERGCGEVKLDWDLRDSPRWVLDWYVRNGFDDREFGNGCALMVKSLTTKK